LGKIPPWVKVSDCKGKSVSRLAFKEFFKGSFDRKIEPTLGQRHKYETCDVIKNDITRLLPCEVLQS
jgi:hypothetical protein